MKTLILLFVFSIAVVGQEKKPTGMNPLYEPNKPNKEIYVQQYWGIFTPKMEELMRVIKEANEPEKKKRKK